MRNLPDSAPVIRFSDGLSSFDSLATKVKLASTCKFKRTSQTGFTLQFGGDYNLNGGGGAGGGDLRGGQPVVHSVSSLLVADDSGQTKSKKKKWVKASEEGATSKWKANKVVQRR